MSDNRAKRKRYFSSNLMTKKRPELCLHTGLRGFISTTNGQEKQCIRESYNVLNEYADKIYGDENKVEPESESNDEKKDIMDEFKSEVASLQAKNSKSGERRFQAINTGINNCIFIKTNLDDPVSLMDHIVTDLFATKAVKTRYLMRMVPIEITCKAYIDEIKIAFKPLLEKYFTSEPTSFGVIFNRRHNSNLDRDAVINELAELVSNQNKDHKVNLTNPAHTIIVEVMKNICGLSVVPNYFQYSKYNLNSICGIDQSTADKNKYKPSQDDPTTVKNDDASDVSSSTATASNVEQNQKPEGDSMEDVSSTSGTAEAPQSTSKTVPQTNEKNTSEVSTEDANCKGEPTPERVTSADSSSAKEN